MAVIHPQGPLCQLWAPHPASLGRGRLDRIWGQTLRTLHNSICKKEGESQGPAKGLAWGTAPEDGILLLACPGALSPSMLTEPWTPRAPSHCLSRGTGRPPARIADPTRAPASTFLSTRRSRSSVGYFPKPWGMAAPPDIYSDCPQLKGQLPRSQSGKECS